MPTRRLPVLLLLWIAATPTPLHGQTAIAADSAEGARLFTARKWAEAANVYDRMTRADSTRAGAWMRLGTALDSLGRRTDALRAYEGARRSGAPVAPAMYQIARTHAGLGAADRALAYLDSAAVNGYQGFEVLRGAPEFARLRGRDQYQRLLARVEQSVPMPHEPHRSTVRFLGRRLERAGQWHRSRDESHRAHRRQVRAARELGDPERSARQEPELLGSTAAALAADLRIVTSRMTFIPMARDTVRQRIEVSSDSGRTWTPGFDALYIRRRAP